MTPEAIKLLAARTAYENYRSYCLEIGESPGLPWEEIQDSQRMRALEGVEDVLATHEPEILHQRWLETKLAEGWKYGSCEDPKQKTHPFCLPYNEIPPDHRFKNALFFHTVKGILALHGLLKGNVTTMTGPRSMTQSSRPRRAIRRGAVTRQQEEPDDEI